VDFTIFAEISVYFLLSAISGYIQDGQELVQATRQQNKSACASPKSRKKFEFTTKVRRSSRAVTVPVSYKDDKNVFTSSMNRMELYMLVEELGISNTRSDKCSVGKRWFLPRNYDLLSIYPTHFRGVEAIDIARGNKGSA